MALDIPDINARLFQAEHLDSEPNKRRFRVRAMQASSSLTRWLSDARVPVAIVICSTWNIPCQSLPIDVKLRSSLGNHGM